MLHSHRSRLLILVVGLAGCGSPATQQSSSPIEPPIVAVPEEALVPTTELAPGDPQWLEEYKARAAAIRDGKTPPPATQPVAQPVAPGAAQPVPAAPVALPATTSKPVAVPVTAPTEMLPPPPPAPAPVQDKPAPATAPATAPTPISTGDLSLVLEQSRQHAALVDDRVAALVAAFVQAGVTAMNAGDLQAAHDNFANAYELDPTDPAARDLFERTGALLGDKNSELAVVALGARDKAGARLQQAELEVRSLIEQGRVAMAAGDPETGKRKFEDALALLKASPSAQDGTLSEAGIAAMVSAARRQAEDLESKRGTRLITLAQKHQEELDLAEATQLERQVAALMDTANTAFLKDDFVAAEAALAAVLEIDPQNAGATELQRVVGLARHNAKTGEIRREYKNEWQDTFDEIAHEAMPQNDIVLYPEAKDWEKISDRGAKVFAGNPVTTSELDTAVSDQLQKRIPVSFKDEPLDGVLTHLKAVSGVNFLLSPAVRDLGGTQAYTLEDRAPQSIERILKILLEDLSETPLSYTVRDGVVRIITKDEARNDYVLQMYDIKDLTLVAKDYKAEDFNLRPSGVDKESYTTGVEDDEPLAFIGADKLLTLIQDNIAKESWTDDPNRTIQLLKGTLVVRQTPEVQAQIRALLLDLRANSGTLINIETRFIEVEDSFLEDIGVDLRGLPGDLTGGFPLEDFGQSGAGGFGTPSNPTGIGTGNDPGFYNGSSNGDVKGRIENLYDFSLGESGTLNNAGGLSVDALFLNDTNVNAVLHAVEKYQTSNVVNAPTLTLRSGQRGNVKALSIYSYVRDFEPEIAQSAVIAQPELDNVMQGVMLDVRAVASADRRFVTLELRPTVTALIPDETGDVLPDVAVSLGTPGSNDVIIELPELRVQRVRTVATIPDGATLMLGGLKTSVDQNNNSGVPFISDIPVLGALFTRQGEYTSKRKLIILLKATILVSQEHEPNFGFTR